MKIVKELKDRLTILIPVHELNDITSELLKKSLESVKKQNEDVKIVIVHPDNDELNEKVVDVIASTDLDINLVSQIKHTGETDFCSQVNYGVSKIDTEFFSILEFDDEYSDIYFKNVREYLNAYPDVSCYIPITLISDTANNGIALVNQDVWAFQFSEKQGFLDVNSLLVHNNFMISGAIINREAFEEVGGLKGDIKLFFIYEFLLRFINNDFYTMVIPKIGYKHMFDREGSLFMQYKDPVEGIKPEETKFYLEAAKNEYFFNPREHTTRKIKYSVGEVK